MRRIYTIILLLLFTTCALGDEFWVDADKGNDNNPGTRKLPLKTPMEGVYKCGNIGGTVHLKGIFYSGIRVKKTHFQDELVIDGHNKTLIYGFYGDYKEFDPANPPARSWQVVEVMDCANVTVKNLEVWGGCDWTAHIDDSYSEIGVRNIVFQNLVIRYGAPRCLFMGGNNIDGVTIKNCVVRENMYGDTTHAIYLSGGHWDGNYPPIRNIKVLNNEVCYAGGRHCLQINGRFENVRISGNTFYHGELAGMSIIGVQNAVISENAIYGNNRQAIVLYDYKDGWFDPNNQPSVQAWLTHHHPNQNITIRNNTIVGGPTQYKMDLYHNNKPDEHAAILITNEVALEIEYPNKNIRIRDNVIYSADKKVLNFGHAQEAFATRVFGNIVWSRKSSTPYVRAPFLSGWLGFAFLETYAPYWYGGNIIVNPEFKEDPHYRFINLCEQPYYNWKNHESEADLRSDIARQFRKGKSYMFNGCGGKSVDEEDDD